MDLGDVTSARQSRDQAQEQLEETVCAAWRTGRWSMTEIAQAAGMSHRGVSRMLERRGVRRPLSLDEMDRARREFDGERE